MIPRISDLVVVLPSVATLAGVEDCGAFVGAAKLLGVVADFVPAAFLACLLDNGAGLHIGLGQSLHLRPLRAQGRREGSRLRLGNDDLGRGIFAGGAAHLTGEDSLPRARVAVEEIAAVSAEDE